MEAAVANARAIVVFDRRLADRVAVDSMSFARRRGHFTSALQHWTAALDQGDHYLDFFGPFGPVRVGPAEETT
ncbi:hypothetical protein V8E54_015054 [Elaphomyces granulatus]|jgi:hypothetical protein